MPDPLSKMYHGCLIKSLAIDYPPTIYHPDTVLINPELTITDVPRLNNGAGQSKLELTSGDAAMPAVGIFSQAFDWQEDIQNKHAAPGICTASGDCLLKLYRATGDTLYLALLKDISHNIIEFMSFKEHALGSKTNGYISERVNLSDWEGN